MSPGQHTRHLIRKSCFQSTAPCIPELDTIDFRDDVDPNRMDADLEDQPRSRKVVGGEVLERCAERRERGEHASCVRGIGPHPQIEILRGAHKPMRGERVRADYEKFNAMCVELG